MRLLQRADDGGLSLTNDLGDDGIPRRYAILSHTWIHGEEVTFNDFIGGAGREKAGYKKIRFCGEQAARDGIRFFWIDTCCIDKSNHVELQYAVNSMFRYYRNAAKCYVYLPDVSQQPSDSDQTLPHPWESAFLRSRWFTRGWTLQELLAPKNVEFFSENDEHLGSKMSLERQIREATGIPVKALRGETPLSEFSVVERISWAEKRETKYPEDKAYSLLGLLGVFMPLNYGEGEGNAFRRLRNEIKSATQGKLRSICVIRESLTEQGMNAMSSPSRSVSLMSPKQRTSSRESQSLPRCTVSWAVMAAAIAALPSSTASGESEKPNSQFPTQRSTETATLPCSGSMSRTKIR
jgi:hypothetical protein